MEYLLKKLKPVQIIPIGFMIVILLGTFLLNLPIASQNGESIGVIDAFFTASSAVCVTGLVVVNTLSHWTLFGKIVIICLIQVGGLGFMTIVTLILMLIGKKITLKERIIIQESLNQVSLEGMVKLVRRICIGTFFIESIGAIILTIRFSMDYDLIPSIGMGIFHAISAFCNAGFDVIGDSSLMPYSGDIVINLVIMSLIVLGGIGYTVWVDFYKIYKAKKEMDIPWKRALKKLSLHTKLVLIITAALITSGAIFFFICEFDNSLTMGGMPMGERVLASFMQSVTVRTAGFNSIDQAGMTYASKFMSIMLMFVGGSPSGTAGGIKTTTLGVILIAVISICNGRSKITIMERNIPSNILFKSLAVFFVSFASLVLITMLLIFTENAMAANYEFLDLLYETASAIGTVGLTTGVTPTLSPIGRIIIALGMYLGRLGPITMILALAKKQNVFIDNIDYPEEKIMVG